MFTFDVTRLIDLLSKISTSLGLYIGVS